VLEEDAVTYDHRISVPQVFRAMGITPTNEQSWAVGTRVATMYADEFGEQPPKDNRRKTSGAGSHCFALYPPSWETIIRAEIKKLVDFERAQTSLFPD
jgi:hypothetical protein